MNRALPASVLRDIGVQAEPRVLLRPMRNADLAALPASHDDAFVPVQAGKVPSQATDSQHHTAILPHQDGADAGSQRIDAASLAQAYQEGLQQAQALSRQQGFQQGLEEGRQQGMAEARSAAEQAWQVQSREHQEVMDARIARLNQLLDSLTPAIAARIAAAEDDMVALCHAVICRFFGNKLLSREIMMPLVQQAIREYCGESGQHGALQGAWMVHVHPQDMALLKNDGGLLTWLQQYGVQTLQWLPDEQVELGGCMVRSAQGTLDARLEIQFAALRDTLLQGRKQIMSELQKADAQ